MVPANKILTVAYGTFSCTLEGFDDPFSTMTDIAEYFRDLAADDRFFGAEPPTPDMAMLRTIAETRAKHAVTAQPDESGVTLRPTAMPAAVAADATAEAAPEIEETAPRAEAQNSTEEETRAAEAPVADVIEDEATTQDDAATDVPEIDGPEIVAAEAQDDADAEIAVEDDAIEESLAKQEDVAAESHEADAEDDSVAAKLARIRGVVEADRQAAGTYAEDEHAEDPMIGAPEMADDTLAAAFAADALDEEPMMIEEAQADLDALADLPEADTAVEETVAEAAPVEADLDDTIASDLAAILGPETDEAPKADEAPEVEPVEEAAAQDEAASGDAAAEPDASTTVDADAEASEPESRSERIERRIRVRKVRRVQAAAEAAALAVADDAVVDAEDAAPAADDGAVDAGEAQAVANPAPEDSDEDELMAELAAIEAELTRPDTAAVSETETQTDAPSEDEDLSDDADLMAELAALRGETPAVAEEPEQTDGPVEDDDADVLAEIAEEIEDDEVRADTVEEAAAEDADDTAPETDETDEIEDAEEATAPPAPDMERLFAATDSRLSGEDTSRRHANISHLKAAVAARRADGPVEAKEEAETDAYRADLASTVRPRRKPMPTETGKRTERPERSAPLVLVSEQRVEETPAAEAAPVQPRRAPRTAEMDMQQDALAGAEDFESFATDVGASELSDILEAAAVYSAKVMGQDNFSRPRLLHLAAEAVEDMSREDGLRGFGQLLRDGTIRKVSRGTFALAAESRYAQEADRRAG